MSAPGANSSLYHALNEQAYDALLFLAELFRSCVSYIHVSAAPELLDQTASYTEKIFDSLYFSEIELLLLKTFVVILGLTLFLIVLSWKVYGKRISERFMRPATSATIEQLKESVSKLKLPKEHTPRI